MESKIEGRLIVAATSSAQKIAFKIKKNGIKCYKKIVIRFGGSESSGIGLIIFFTSLISTSYCSLSGISDVHEPDHQWIGANVYHNCY